MRLHRTITIVIAAALLLAATIPAALAHHAFGSEFDPNRPVLLKGKVVRVEWVNPHAWIHLEVTNPDGTKVPIPCSGGE
jgi:hypothetical protein